MSQDSNTAVAARIAGTGHYVPEKVLSNHDLEKIVDTSDEWIVERTGIRERRIAAEGENTSDMAAAAARQALEAAELDAEDVDLILVTTVTPDMPLPATAVYVQQKIGARNTCPAMDLAAACAGFVYGMSIADQYIRTGAAKNVLVIGVELLSRVLDWNDRSTCVLFGDGAGAVVVSPGQEGSRGEILSTHIYADGSFASALCIPGGGTSEPATHDSVDRKRHVVHMVGKDIFRFAVRALAEASREALSHNGLGPDDVTWCVPHQANIRILEGVSQRCGIPMDRFYINIDRYGNTSSASVPIALDEAVRDKTIGAGDLLLMCALGGGIAWGSALVRW